MLFAKQTISFSALSEPVPATPSTVCHTFKSRTTTILYNLYAEVLQRQEKNLESNPKSCKPVPASTIRRSVSFSGEILCDQSISNENH